MMNDDNTTDTSQVKIHEEMANVSKEEVRKSARSKRPPQAFTLLLEADVKPENGMKATKKRKLKGRSAATAPDRPCDIMPDGQPFQCDFCKSPYVITRSSKQALKNKRSRHTPAPRNKIDPYTGKILILCNACSITFDRPRKPRKIVSMPSAEDRERSLKEAQEFAKNLAVKLNKPEAERLFCPSVRVKPCGCLQKYIMADGDGEESEKRAEQMVSLLLEAKRLSAQKCYQVQSKTPSPPADKKPYLPKWPKAAVPIGIGNGQKKSKAFEEFIFTKRKYLKQDLRLCERAAQKVLVYSNNFLHKKLITEQKACRAAPVKGLARLGLLLSWDDIAVQQCCVDNCVMMAVTHRKLLQEWRDRARKGQLEARRVIAEMLTPSAGARSNCYTFITMVTGSSRSTIVQVSHQMKQTGGEREPPVHGMKKYWKDSKRRPDTHISKLSPRTSVKSSSTASCTASVTTTTSSSVKSLPVTTTSSSVIIPVAVNQTSSSNNNVNVQRQQLLGIQKQMFEQQVQQQQQQHLLQQQLLQHTLIQQIGQSDTASQNLTVLQHMIDQLNVQIQNTQQQLQQSLQNMNIIGALNNQSQTGTYPVNVQPINQSQPAALSSSSVTGNGSVVQNTVITPGQPVQLNLSQTQYPQVVTGVLPNMQIINQLPDSSSTGVQTLQIQNQDGQILRQQFVSTDGKVYPNIGSQLNVYQESENFQQVVVNQTDVNENSQLMNLLPDVGNSQQQNGGKVISQTPDRHAYTYNQFNIQHNPDFQTGVVIYDLNCQPNNQAKQVHLTPTMTDQVLPGQQVYTTVENIAALGMSPETQQLIRNTDNNMEGIHVRKAAPYHEVNTNEHSSGQGNVMVAPNVSLSIMSDSESRATMAPSATQDKSSSYMVITQQDSNTYSIESQQDRCNVQPCSSGQIDRSVKVSSAKDTHITKTTHVTEEPSAATNHHPVYDLETMQNSSREMNTGISPQGVVTLDHRTIQLVQTHDKVAEHSTVAHHSQTGNNDVLSSLPSEGQGHDVQNADHSISQHSNLVTRTVNLNDIPNTHERNTVKSSGDVSVNKKLEHSRQSAFYVCKSFDRSKLSKTSSSASQTLEIQSNDQQDGSATNISQASGVSSSTPGLSSQKNSNRAQATGNSTAEAIPGKQNALEKAIFIQNHTMDPNASQMLELSCGSTAYAVQIPIKIASNSTPASSVSTIRHSEGALPVIQTQREASKAGGVTQPVQYVSVPASVLNNNTLMLQASHGKHETISSGLNQSERGQRSVVMTPTAHSQQDIVVNPTILQLSTGHETRKTPLPQIISRSVPLAVSPVRPASQVKTVDTYVRPNIKPSVKNVSHVKVCNLDVRKPQEIPAAVSLSQGQNMPPRLPSDVQTFQLQGSGMSQTLQVPSSAIQVPSGAALVQLGTPTSRTSTSIPVVMTLGKVFLEQSRSNSSSAASVVPSTATQSPSVTCSSTAVPVLLKMIQKKN